MKNYALGLYEKSMPDTLTLAQKLAKTKESGFDYLELSIDESDEKLARLHWSDKEIRKIQESIASTGIPIKSICLSGHRRFPLGHPKEDVRRQGMEILKKAVRLASVLPVRIIQLAGYDVYYETGSTQTQALFRDNLARAAEIAAREGVMLAFETMETPFMDTMEKAMRYVRQIDNPYLQIYPDWGNLTNAAVRYHTDLKQDFLLGQGHICAMHLKETRPQIFREVPYGDGHVDFELGIALAWQAGVRMFVGELWHAGNPEWEQALISANHFLRDKVIAACLDQSVIAGPQ